ncbi:hypothetical protein AUC61_21720 [Pseudomonas sp. S25]|uniref:Uncharacterized protein n=1 Tax=Pseudomonas maioricensis TaxID=1766623 RepID=A0ABS9ZNK8_9PSED|nr:hypothetical protein [Pseudomonas sp. S25]
MKVQAPCADWTMKLLPTTGKSIMQLRVGRKWGQTTIVFMHQGYVPNRGLAPIIFKLMEILVI